MRGIDAAAIYVPELRLPISEITEAWGQTTARGIDQTAVPDADEDAITMAVAAGDRVLNETHTDSTTVTSVYFATTTPPLDEGATAATVVRALGLPSSTQVRNLTGTTAAAGAAIDGALNADGTALVLASDIPTGSPSGGDHPMGAGAVALLIADNAASEVTTRVWRNDDHPGIRFRRRGTTTVESMGITPYERNRITSQLGEAIDGLEINFESVDGMVLHQPTARFPHRIANQVGSIDPTSIHQELIVNRIGDAGAATVPIGLVSAADQFESGTLVCGFYGAGEAMALAVSTDFHIYGIESLDSDRTLPYSAYLRRRGFITDGSVSGGGAYVPMPNWQSSLDQRYLLKAGRCRECNELSFPPRGACQSCRYRRGYDEVELSRTGTVQAVTVIGQGGAPPEFAEQQQRRGAFGVAIIELTEPGTDRSVNIPAQLTDFDPGTVTVGDEVSATFRRIYEQEGVPRYGIKFSST